MQAINFDRWTSSHTFALVRSAIVGAVTVGIAAALTYFQSVPAETLMGAFTSRAALVGILAGALVAGAQAMLNLASHSYIAPVSGAQGSSPGLPAMAAPVTIKEMPVLPAPGSRPGDPLRRLSRLFALAVVVLVVGCIPSPVSQATDALSLVNCVKDNWGRPFQQVVLTCAPNEETVIADIIADVQVIFARSADGGAPVASPYTDEPKVAARMPMAFARARTAP